MIYRTYIEGNPQPVDAGYDERGMRDAAKRRSREHPRLWVQVRSADDVNGPETVIASYRRGMAT